MLAFICRSRAPTSLPARHIAGRRQTILRPQAHSPAPTRGDLLSDEKVVSPGSTNLIAAGAVDWILRAIPKPGLSLVLRRLNAHH